MAVSSLSTVLDPSGSVTGALAYLSPVSGNLLSAVGLSSSTASSRLLGTLSLGATGSAASSVPAGAADLDLLSTNVELTLVAAALATSTGSGAVTLLRPGLLMLEGLMSAESSADAAVSGRPQVNPLSFVDLKLGSVSKLRRRVRSRFERRPDAGNG